MSNRTTIAHLNAIIERINRMTNSPLKPYVIGTGARYYVAQVGNYHLSQQYGGVALHRMHNEGGGIEDVLRVGHVPKSKLERLLHAFIAGLEAQR